MCIRDSYRYLKKLSELSNYHEKQVELIAVDSAGHYYTEHGRMGLMRGMNYLESAPERVSYVSNSLTVDDSRMAVSYTHLICGVSDQLAAETTVTDSGVVGMDAAKAFFGAYTTISRADTAWS